MGAPKEVVQELGEKEPPVYEVWEENWDAVRLFVKLATQWVLIQGAVVGLNYQSLEFLFKIYKIKDRVGVFEQIQVMELFAVGLLNKKGK